MVPSSRLPPAGLPARDIEDGQDSERRVGGRSLRTLLALSRAIDAFNTRDRTLAVLADRGRGGRFGDQCRSSARSSTFPPIPGSSCNGCCSASCSCCARPGRCSNNEHIRIDIINHSLPLKLRGWIDMIGHLFFLMPFCDRHAVAGRSRSSSVPANQNEQSFSAGGLPQWPAKSLIMIACVLLMHPGHLRNHQARRDDARDHSRLQRIRDQRASRRRARSRAPGGRSSPAKSAERRGHLR